ncbi:efflux transporter outer membrane subunit [Trinickia diaoshuihuensis]|uniref:efflux transporter outer membrane subunit n=1 Tax=Trinickia diaoshuihuensis TaxID=2292265 RepID=UPI001F075428|nr:efflux transporter outer membrane subunit [Trinickia diaoshuihuensis]
MKSFKPFVGSIVVTTMALLWLSGCAVSTRRAEWPRPEIPATWSAAASRETLADTSSQTAHPAPADRWWERFGDPGLDRLIERALADNADLAMAAIRVRRAQLEAGLVRAQTGPQAALTAGGGVTRAFGADRARFSTGANAALSFELDLWGKLAARRDEATWRAQASEADRDAAALLLIGTTAKLYWGIGYLNEAIALDEASIVDAQETAALIEARVAAGAASRLDAAQARQALAVLRAGLAQAVMERETKRNALALLLDRPPHEQDAEPAGLSSAALPAVTASLPAVVLARRPDLRAAELRLRARLANLDVARASMYPDITLTSEFGTSSDMLLRTLQNPVASLGAALALPFVQWNAVRLKAAMSESEFDEASIAFRRDLYGALAEVEDLLTAKTQLETQADERSLALAEATLAVSLIHTRFELGTSDAAPWLAAQQARRLAERNRVAAQLSCLENRIDLFLALGGG